MTYTRLTIIIPAADQATENDWWNDNIDPNGSTFTAPLCAPAAPTIITHYWASAPFTDEQVMLIAAHFGANAHTGEPNNILAAVGLQRYSPPLI